jgi:cyclopropane fatty-acyl-phospholipid synthase-like methyltransferase
MEKPAKDLVEIGGFPGRFLAYLGWKYNLKPTSIDFNSNIDQIKEHFDGFGIKEYSIINEDFFKFEPKEKYDLVLSNGFIEHFKNYDYVLDLHVEYMKKGSILIVIIPNMKGFIKYYKSFFDKENLQKHTLDSMKLSVFQKFAERKNLNLIKCEFFGDFPFNVHQELTGFKKHAQKVSRIIFKYAFNRLIKKYPGPYFSSGIIAILKK